MRMRKLVLLLAVVATVSVLAIAGVGSVSGQENSVGVRYDANGNNRIDRDELLAAVDDHLFTDLVTRDEVLELIGLYLFNEPVTPPTPSFADGTWSVGSDIIPQTYAAPGGPSCYWGQAVWIRWDDR